MNNRIVKFRAWDKYLRQYINNIEFLSNGYFSSDGCPVFLMEGKSGDYQNLEESFENNFILQQFTGLRDKNNKEIYEGDIVTDKHYGGIYKVFWYDTQASFCLAVLNKNSIEDFLCDISAHIINFYKIEVIGNIFQNPELLK